MNNALIICPQDTLTPVVSAELIAMREAAFAGTALVGKVTTDEQNEAATLAVAPLTDFKNHVNKAHKEAKEPYLRVCQLLDETKRTLLDGVFAEENRICILTGNYKQEQLEIIRQAARARDREIARIEAERKAEEARIAAEAAKIACEKQAALDKIEAERKAEEARIAAEAATATNAKARAAAADRQKQIDAERALAAAAAAKEQADTTARLERERLAREALVEQERLALAPVQEMKHTAGQTVKVRMTFTVTDIYKLVRVRPDLCKIEAATQVINEAIAMGMKVCPGLEIFEEVKTSTRPRNVGRKVIDI